VISEGSRALLQLQASKHASLACRRVQRTMKRALAQVMRDAYTHPRCLARVITQPEGTRPPPHAFSALA
jgi:hypothetical protein